MSASPVIVLKLVSHRDLHVSRSRSIRRGSKTSPIAENEVAVRVVGQIRRCRIGKASHVQRRVAGREDGGIERVECVQSYLESLGLHDAKRAGD